MTYCWLMLITTSCVVEEDSYSNQIHLLSLIYKEQMSDVLPRYLKLHLLLGLPDNWLCMILLLRASLILSEVVSSCPSVKWQTTHLLLCHQRTYCLFINFTHSLFNRFITQGSGVQQTACKLMLLLINIFILPVLIIMGVAGMRKQQESSGE